jgi:hypothetical protein
MHLFILDIIGELDPLIVPLYSAGIPILGQLKPHKQEWADLEYIEDNFLSGPIDSRCFDRNRR